MKLRVVDVDRSLGFSTLSVDDVLFIHKKIRDEARVQGEPVAEMNFPGEASFLKNRDLLESAVARQWAGFDGRFFYPTPHHNAATLMYGIAMNHPFHDGNKRTSLVAMLNHLDRNNLVLVDMGWEDVEDLVLDLVKGKLPARSKLKHAVPHIKDRAERSVQALAEWIRLNSRRIDRAEKYNITFDEMERIIRRHGYEFGNPKGNKIDILRVEAREVRKWLRRRTEVRRVRVGTVGYPGGKRQIGVADVKKIRDICNLTEENGVDSYLFYDKGEALDRILNKHRQVLRSLATK